MSLQAWTTKSSCKLHFCKMKTDVRPGVLAPWYNACLALRNWLYCVVIIPNTSN
jgi:hypothetical protein